MAVLFRGESVVFALSGAALLFLGSTAFNRVADDSKTLPSLVGKGDYSFAGFAFQTFGTGGGYSRNAAATMESDQLTGTLCHVLLMTHLCKESLCTRIYLDEQKANCYAHSEVQIMNPLDYVAKIDNAIPILSGGDSAHLWAAVDGLSFDSEEIRQPWFWFSGLCREVMKFLEGFPELEPHERQIVCDFRMYPIRKRIEQAEAAFRSYEEMLENANEWSPALSALTASDPSS